MDKIEFDWGTSNDWYKNQIGNEIFDLKIYERFFEVEKNDIVVDLGASVGIFAFSILERNPKHIFCLEPSQEQFITLIKNTISGYVTCINKGISDVDGKKILNNVYGYENKSLESYTIRFDTLINRYGIHRIDFLKTDCEGGEYHVLNNENIWWIKNNVKKIVGEWHLENDFQKKQFREFRDIYLKLFTKFEIYSVDGIDIKWDIWNDHFIEYYDQVLIFIDNRN